MVQANSPADAQDLLVASLEVVLEDAARSGSIGYLLHSRCARRYEITGWTNAQSARIPADCVRKLPYFDKLEPDPEQAGLQP